MNEETEKIKAIVDRIIFSKNGFTILSAVPKQGPKVTIKGNIEVDKGVLYEFEGKHTIDSKYGMQFNAARATISLNDKHALEQFFCSSKFKGIGLRTFNKMYDALGEDIVEKLTTNINLIDEVDISRKLKDVIKIGMGEYNGELIIRNEFKSVKLKPATLNTIVSEITKSLSNDISDNIGIISKETVEPKAYEIKENPYKLYGASKIKFKEADSIFFTYDFGNYDARNRAGIKYAISEMQENMMSPFNSNTVFVVSDIYNVYKDLVDEMIRPETFYKYIKESKAIVMLDDNHVILKKDHKNESIIAYNIARLSSKSKELDLEKANKIIDGLEKSQGFDFHSCQKDAILNCLQNKISIITGGPGTGKTTVSKAVIDAFEKMYNPYNITLCSLSGKAAKRLSDQTKRPANTIHTTLVMTPGMPPEYNSSHPLPTELIVIDECSMIDEEILNYLLEATPDHASIILIGDIDQLPPVGLGQPFADLIWSGVITTTTLEFTFRQGKDSNIPKMAYQINNGLEIDFTQKEDIIIKELQDEDDIAKEAVKSIKHATIPTDKLDVQVLCATNNMADKINKQMSALNPSRETITINDIVFKVNDKVLCTKNNKEKNLKNGDIGIISMIVGNVMTASFGGELVKINTNNDDVQLKLGYAITIHKSQGSEWPELTLVASRRDFIMAKRKLYYTGITRGKKKVTIIGSTSIIQEASQKLDPPKFTALIHFLKEALKEVEEIEEVEDVDLLFTEETNSDNELLYFGEEVEIPEELEDESDE